VASHCSDSCSTCVDGSCRPVPAIQMVGSSRLLCHHQDYLINLLAGLHQQSVDNRGEPLWERLPSGWVSLQSVAISWELDKCEGLLSVKLMAPHRPGLVRFSMDMVAQGFGQPSMQSIVAARGAEFIFDHTPDQRMVAIELVIQLEVQSSIDELERQLPRLEGDLRVGLLSCSHAARILETRSLSYSSKSLFVQDRIRKLLLKFPERYCSELMAEMQHYLGAFRKDFRNLRRPENLVRIIVSSYLLRRTTEGYGGERSVCMRFISTAGHDIGGRSVGIFLVVQPIRNGEIFDDSHLLSAIQGVWPDAKLVAGSSVLRYSAVGKQRSVYLEITSVNARRVAARRVLSAELESWVWRSVEKLVPPAFMPRNEEEIMRSIVTLSGQLRFVADVPQVIISPDQHSVDELAFIVIIVRLGRPGQLSIPSLMHNAKSFEWSTERSRTVGLLRRRYPKEAFVMRAKAPISRFLRFDRSVDIMMARKAVLAELSQHIGPVRDFNGGLIEQQDHTLKSIRERLPPLGSMQSVMIEEIYHALHPADRVALLSIDELSSWIEVCMNCWMSMATQGRSVLHRGTLPSGSAWAVLINYGDLEQPIAPLIEWCKAERSIIMLDKPLKNGCMQGFLWSRPSSQERDNISALLIQLQDRLGALESAKE